MNPVTVFFEGDNVHMVLTPELLLDHDYVRNHLLALLSAAERDRLRKHKSYVDREKNKMAKEREETHHRELSYIAKLDQERALAQHYYMTIKAIMFVLNTEGVSDAQKLQSVRATLTEQGF